MPLGMDTTVFRLAGWGLDMVRSGAEKLAGFPYAEIQVDSFSSLALGLFAFGIMMICLMKTPLRWAGGLLIMISVLAGILA